MQVATAIVLTAGGMTFLNEWYQTKSINWRVPVATIFLGAGMDVISLIDDKIANMLAIIILIGAGVTEFNGKSAFDTIASFTSQPQTQQPVKLNPPPSIKV